MSELTEVFRPVKGYLGLYEVSNYGRVKSLARNTYRSDGTLHKRIKESLKGRLISTHGYYHLGLCKDSKTKTHQIHLLVWDAFGDKQRDGLRLQVDHKDNNKLNNNIDNLQLLTIRQNVSKGWLQHKKTSRYTGVSRFKDKWQVFIHLNGKNKNLGVFACEITASRAYQKALVKVGVC